MEPGTDCRAETMRPRFSAARLLPILAIAGGLAAFFALGFDQYLSFEALSDNRQALLAWTSEHQVLAALAFIAVYWLAVTFSLPGAVWMTIAGGFLFGTAMATVYVVAGATLGAVAIFLAARYAFADFFRAKAGPFIRKLEDGFRADAFSYLLVLRLVPLFPFWLVNLVPAFLGVSWRTFTVATLVGIVPGTFVYASVGNGLGAVFDRGGRPDLGIIFAPEIILPIVGLALLAMVPVAYKRYKGRRA